MKNIFIISFISIFNIACSQKTTKIAFYNTENYFDTIDGSNDDAEYLPSSKLKWDKAKYEDKRKHVVEVIQALNYPTLIGFCEIENKFVLDDLIQSNKKLKNYKPVHFDSPDLRGIDVGFIYNSSLLKLLNSGNIRFTLPGDTEPRSRDIVWAKFAFKKDTIFAMVNHWPSRRTNDSEPKRVKAAESARMYIDSVLNVNPNAKIVFMGDLNDHPEDKAPSLIAEKLTPMILKTSGEFGGTHTYKGEWGILDHIMVSKGFTSGKLSVIPSSGKINSFEFLMEEYKGNKQPKRTFVGEKYLGGYSDHLPVSIDLKIK
ncbi:MAG: endonuclease/exonuclease/phosphatase family protein [Bacteroidota bacterium]